MKMTICRSVFALVLVGFAGLAVGADQDGVKSLFDGQTLEGWSGKEQFWSVKDGAITGQTTPDNPTKGNTFLIWKGGDVKDFELRLKFKIVGGNSGIQYRSTDMGDFVVGGYQGDIEAGDKYIGILYEERGRGILAERGAKVVIHPDGKKEVVGKTGDSKEIAASVKKEDWNEYEVIAKGNHLIQKINGYVTVDVTDNQSDKAKESGILALQLHAGPPMTVQFKDIQYKELK
ncbi:MAG TPA: DUF1080 domain-containing protein [Pirellulaceae bacterium]|nr:DUF1080 domain-containing protein [Pirellulaceae bacterium]